jgi:hypothetical protein
MRRPFVSLMGRYCCWESLASEPALVWVGPRVHAGTKSGFGGLGRGSGSKLPAGLSAVPTDTVLWRGSLLNRRERRQLRSEPSRSRSLKEALALPRCVTDTLRFKLMSCLDPAGPSRPHWCIEPFAVARHSIRVGTRRSECLSSIIEGGKSCMDDSADKRLWFHSGAKTPQGCLLPASGSLGKPRPRYHHRGESHSALDRGRRGFRSPRELPARTATWKPLESLCCRISGSWSGRSQLPRLTDCRTQI